MTWRKRTIMEMAREAGFNVEQGFLLRITGIDEDLERFTALVREEAIAEANARANASWTLMCEKMVAFEREACAKVCEELLAPNIYSDTDKSMWDVTCIDCAEAIRARSNT